MLGDRSQGQKDADLRILDPTSSASVLPLHADRFVALLEKPRFVHNQHAVVALGRRVLMRVSQQGIPHLVGAPACAIKQPVETLCGVALPACYANCQPFFRSIRLISPRK